ncbi:hypothetical protein VTK56DRAFT_5042 [Thermocarpiscus australiensis]
MRVGMSEEPRRSQQYAGAGLHRNLIYGGQGHNANMTGIWSMIKAAAPVPEHRHESSPSFAGASNNQPSWSPATPPSSIGGRGNQSRVATMHPQSLSPGKHSPSRLSPSNTAPAQKEMSRGEGRETEAEHADADINHAAIVGTGESAGSSVDDARTTPTPQPLAQAPAPSSTIDPLSQHILMRKSTELSIPQRLTQIAEGLAKPSLDISKIAAPGAEVVKDRRKSSTFLSRLSMRGGRKRDVGDPDSDSEMGSETRMDGVNARVFSQSLASPIVGGGYIPHHKEPPRYIRTRAINKRTREFNRMFLAQELVGTQPPSGEGDSTVNAGKAPVVTVSVADAGERKTARTGGAIWATEFSMDGKYLASAGKDHVVRVWAVISTPEERRAQEEDEMASGAAGERLSAPVFRDQPIKEFEGHTGEVLDLSWSKNNFLLSSSMDKTVRLWHVSRSECLCTFKHKDFVTRLAFHPRDDRFFLAGSLDTMLRLWSIPDKAVAFSAQLPDLVTAVAFSPDGKVAIAGLLNGLCMFYETEGLKLNGQIHVRSSRGKNAKGSKITGIQTMAIPPPSSIDMSSSQKPISSSTSRTSTDTAAQEEVSVLVTSNDSRIRIYRLRDKSLHVKLKGHENTCSQIAATFSDDGKYVICGSEDRKTFIWNLTGNNVVAQDKDKPPCESFEAHGEIVTTALFAPTKTRMLLGQSGDPIYDLCNPPPVVLQSLEEAASASASQVALSTTNESLDPAPTEPPSKRPEPSPAYIARSTHYDGNIIVTTGDTGIIKVFRQDCAFTKRRHDSWETGSTFSRKLTAHGSGYVGSGLSRSASVLTRTSAGSTAHSRRTSISQSITPSLIGSPQLSAAGGHSDRILSWRQEIENGSDVRLSVISDGGGTLARSERSVSPAKASRTSLNSTANLASEGRIQPYSGSLPARNRAGSVPTSPTTSAFSNTPDRVPTRLIKDKDRAKDRHKPKAEEPSLPPIPSFTFRPASGEAQAQPGSAGGSSSFWNLNRWRGISGFRASSSGQGLTGGRARSSGSRPSFSKPRNQADGSGDEREVEGRAENLKQPGPSQECLDAAHNDAEVSDAKADPGQSVSSVVLGQGGSGSDARSVPTEAGAQQTDPR